MSTKLFPVGSTVVRQLGAKVGQYTWLNFVGLSVADQGQALGIQVPAAALDPEMGKIFWRPDSPSSGMYVQTWAEVQAAIAATTIPLTVYLDRFLDAVDGNSLVIPGDSGVTNCRGLVTFAGNTLGSVQVPGAPRVGLIVTAGASLLDPVGFRRLKISLGSDAGGPALAFSYSITPDQSVLYLDDCVLGLDEGPSPGILVPGTCALYIFCTNVGSHPQPISGSTTQPMFSVAGFLGLYVLGPWELSDGFASGVGTVWVVYDGELQYIPVVAGLVSPVAYYPYTGPSIAPVRGTTVASLTAYASEFVSVGLLVGDITITLPASAPAGSSVIVKCTETSAHTVTVQGQGANTIDGFATDSFSCSELRSRTYTYYPDNWVISSAGGPA